MLKKIIIGSSLLFCSGNIFGSQDENVHKIFSEESTAEKAEDELESKISDLTELYTAATREEVKKILVLIKNGHHESEWLPIEPEWLPIESELPPIPRWKPIFRFPTNHF